MWPSNQVGQSGSSPLPRAALSEQAAAQPAIAADRTILRPWSAGERTRGGRATTTAVVFASVATMGALVGVGSARSLTATQFSRSELRCITPEEAAMPPSADGAFALGGLPYAAPAVLAPTATMIDPELLDAPSSALATAMTITRTVAAKVPHQVQYLPIDDPTQLEFDPEAALTARRTDRRGGTCSTRAGLVVLELWRRGLPARMAQMTFEGGGGHVVAEVWSGTDQRWIAVDPSVGAYLTIDGRPAGVVDRLMATDRYAWTQFGPEAELFPPFHTLGATHERRALAQVAWPEPWLLSHKGPRPDTWARSAFAVTARHENGPCRTVGAARAGLGLGGALSAIGAIGFVASLRRRRRG